MLLANRALSLLSVSCSYSKEFTNQNQNDQNLSPSLRNQKIVHYPSERKNNNLTVDQLDIPTLKWLLKGQVTLEEGRLLHSCIAAQGLDQDTLISNHLISMYGKLRALPDAHSVFKSLQCRDVVSWNAMISVYTQNGCQNEAFDLFIGMEHNGMNPDIVTFISILKTCNSPEDLSKCQWIHACVIFYGFESDSLVSTALLNVYGKSGEHESAEILFHKLDPFDTIPWNALIGMYSQQGYHYEALDCFYHMLSRNIQPDKITFICVLSACANLQALNEGKDIHTMIREYGFESVTVVGNALISMYGKCIETEVAWSIFDRMQERDLSSWNAMIGAYAYASDAVSASKLFVLMQQQNVKPDKITYVSLLCACENMTSVQKIEQIHAYTVYDGFELDIVVSTELLNIYGQCRAFTSAMILFNRMPQHNTVSWNAVISVKILEGQTKKAIELFEKLVKEDMEIDEVTFISALTACQNATTLGDGRMIHAHIINTGYDFNVVVGNALVSMYGRCKALEDACVLFENIPQRNVVTWNATIDAHVQMGQGKEALFIFKKMQDNCFQPDEATHIIALGGCESQGDLAEGRFIHMCCLYYGLRSEALQGALVNMYGKCNMLEDAEVVFNIMDHDFVGSWNNIISAYNLQGKNEEAILLYKQMQHLDVVPNKVTCITVLNACISLTALDEAQMIHGLIIMCGFESDALVGTALMNIYGKCGALEDAHIVFDLIGNCDVIAWNALISIYAQQGHAEASLTIFNEMIANKIRPDDVTFLNVLSSCCHGGLLHEGQYLFDSLSKNYGIEPTLEIYGCMVDLYGRAGQLSEAEDFILNRSLQHHGLLWTNLLGACKLHDDVERGKRTAERIAALEAQDSATYVLLANMQ